MLFRRPFFRSYVRGHTQPRRHSLAENIRCAANGVAKLSLTLQHEEVMTTELFLMSARHVLVGRP
jgi:hypothetical protein